MKLKKKTMIILTASVILVTTITVVLLTINRQHINSDDGINRADMSGYTELKDRKHVYELIEIDDAMKLFENGTGTLYIGRENCEYCQLAVPMLNEAAKEKGSTVFYLDIERFKDDEVYKSKVNEIFDLLRFYYEDGPVIPTVVAIKEGVIKDFVAGTIDVTVDTYKETIDVLLGNIEKDFALYYEPKITINEGYEEMITYIVGKDFDINNFVTYDCFRGRIKESWFEMDNPEDDYLEEGIHDITIFVTDEFDNSTNIKAKLLTEKEEVIKKLTESNQKLTLSNYQAYKETEKKAKPKKDGDNTTQTTTKTQTATKTFYSSGSDNPWGIDLDYLNGTGMRSCGRVADAVCGMYGYCNYVYYNNPGHTAIRLEGDTCLHGGYGNDKKVVIGSCTNIPNTYESEEYDPHGIQAFNLKYYGTPYDPKDLTLEESRKIIEKVDEEERKRQEAENQPTPEPTPQPQPEPTPEPTPEPEPTPQPETAPAEPNDTGTPEAQT